MKTRNTGALIIVVFTLIVFVFTAACSLTVHLGGKYYSNDPVPVGGVSVEYGGNDDGKDSSADTRATSRMEATQRQENDRGRSFDFDRVWSDVSESD